LTHPLILAHSQQERKYKKITLFFWNSGRRITAIILDFSVLSSDSNKAISNYPIGQISWKSRTIYEIKESVSKWACSHKIRELKKFKQATLLFIFRTICGICYFSMKIVCRAINFFAFPTTDIKFLPKWNSIFIQY